MEKEFVPHEYALELKEIGFNVHSFGYYHNLGSKQLVLSKRDLREDSNDSIQYFLSPTFSQVFRWFRDKYGLYHTIHYTNKKYTWLVYDSDVNFRIDNAQKHEEAELLCLKQLIEIAKTKN